MKLRRRHPVAALIFLLGFVTLSGSAQAADTLYYLHSNGNVCTPGPDPAASTFSLDGTGPTASDAKCRDSSSVNRTTYVEIGTWSAALISPAQQIISLSDLHAWIGLKDSNDIGTYFDLEAQLLKNGVVVASGVTKTIQGVTRNANQAKEVTVTFGAISDNQLSAGDVLSVKILTKVADSGGHSNAVGLRMYYDSTTRPSRFGATISPVSTLGNLTQARSGHAATLQSDGGVLITGGQNTSGTLASAERFDPLSLTFSPLTANMGTSRTDHTASALANQTTLIVAGQNAGGIMSGAELYDPSTGLFSGLSDTVRISRSGHTATVLLDGRVLIVGGQGATALGSTETFDAQSAILFKSSFDPQAGAFTVLPNALLTARWDHTATLLADGRVLITGGRNDSGSVSSAELFDPVTESFAAVPGGMTIPRSGHTATLMPDGRVLLLGGQNDAGYMATGEWFDPATGTFAAASQGLTTQRADHAATLLYSGEILITGGVNSTGVLASTEFYGPPQTDTTSPTVAQVTPKNGATGIDLTEIIGVRFSELVDVTTLNYGSISLTGSGAVDSIIGPSEQGLMVFVVPKNPLSPGTTYTLSLTSSVRDTSGNPLVPFTSSFTTVAAPTITNVQPNHAPGGTGVTITGQNFDPSAPTKNVVKFGGISAVVASATATQIETSVPLGAQLGAGTVTVTTRGGTASAAFTVENPVPTLVLLTPNSVVAGSGAFTLTLTGGNFIASSQVKFGGVVLIPSFVSATQLQVNVPASAVVNPGTVQVTVTNPAPGGGISNALPFNVIGPVITNLSPDNGPIGTPVTITGLNFDPTASNNQVKFNGSPAIITSASATQITTTVPQGATTGTVTVATPTGTAASSVPFTVTLSQDFNLIVSPASAGLVAGSYRYISIGAAGVNGFSDWILLSTGLLPYGLSMLFLPPQVSPGGLSMVEIVSTSATVPGTYPVTFTGTAIIDGQTFTRNATLLLQILEGGTTTLIGQVLSTDSVPIGGAFVTLGNTNAFTDASGTFFLRDVPTGHQMVLVDGRTANAPGTFYPAVDVSVDIVTGTANVMPYIVYLPRIDIAHPINLPVDSSGTITQEFTATTPAIPGLEVRFPVGTQIIDPDGNPVSQITITAVPPDRAPMPLPAGVDAAQLFSIQPGGATLSQPVPITFPNFLNGEPGARSDFYFFDVTTGAWTLYGQGAVSPDGRQVVPDPGVGIPRFAWHVTYLQIIPDPKPYEKKTLINDPVDLSTGMLMIEKTDMVIPGRLPITLTRTYNPLRAVPGPFGIGSGHSYEAQLVSVGGGEGLILIQGDDTRFRFSRSSGNTFVSENSPTMRGAVITVNGDNSRTLRQKDGSILTFNPSGRLIQKEDRNGNKILIDRDGGGRILTVREPSGRSLTFAYDGANRVTSITDSLGRRVTYHYNALGRLDIVTDPAGGEMHYSYDVNNRMATITDARGIAYLQSEYDSNGRVIRQINADGGEYRYMYFGPNGLALLSVPTARVGPLSRGCGGRIIVLQPGAPVPGGCVITIIQTSPASLFVAQAVVIDPEGNPTSYRFNSNGFLIEQTDAMGQTTKFDREIATNRLLSTTDPLGRTTVYAYDANENVTAITDPQGNVTSFTYEPTFSRVASITDAAGHNTSFSYDAQGNLISTTDPSSATTQMTYNPQGQPVSVMDPLGNTTQFEYDTAGNLTATSDPIGNRTVRAYDLVSRLIGLTDPLNHTTSYSYDTLNRVTQITDALNGVTGFTYDANGNLLTVTDAKSQATTYTYESMDRLATRTDPLSRQESYSYDLRGNLNRFTDRKGQVSQFTYDAVNHRTQSSYGDGSSTAFTYDAVSRLMQVNDSISGLIQMSYDNLNRLTQELTSQGAVSYGYDAIGRRTSMNVNGLSPVTYQYDNTSRLTQVAQDSRAVNLNYDAAGRRTSLTYPNGTSATYLYDSASRLSEILHQGPSGVIEDLLYTYDVAGNRISFDRTNPQAELPQTVQAAYNAANQMTQFNTDSLTYDANGNLTSDGTTAYTWDARNRLIQMSSGSLFATFTYDAFGRRVSKTINGVTTQYLYDGNDIMAEIQNGAISATYLRGLNIDEPFLRSSAVAEYYHTDALGSVFALTDQNGVVQTSYNYDPFGNTTIAGSFSNPFQYTGRENDGTGVYYYRERYYSPNLQRFISEDPIEFSGGDLDLYNYVNNNPLKWIDPLGLSKFDQLFGLPKQFWKWYHRIVKRPGEPDLTKEEARKLYEEWKDLGKPKPDNKGFVDIDVLLWFAPLWVTILTEEPEIAAPPCEMPGGPPCGFREKSKGRR